MCVQEEGRMIRNNIESAHTTFRPQSWKGYLETVKRLINKPQNGLNKGINKSSHIILAKCKGHYKACCLFKAWMNNKSM